MIIVDLLITIFIQNDKYNSWLKAFKQFVFKLLYSFQSTVVFVIQYKMIISKSTIIIKI